MNINVPISACDHFWQEPPPGHREFWSLRFKPRCQIGDPIRFFVDGKLVAEAVVSEIEPPGRSQCESTGRFARGWKVFWEPQSFVDLRKPEAVA
jgi:hypothetical protein